MASITTTFKGQPVLIYRPDFRVLQRGILDDFEFNSKAFGLGTPWRDARINRRRASMPFLLDDKEIVKRWRVFRHDRRGIRKGFWLPLYLSDYWLVQSESAGAGSVTIERNSDSYGDRFAVGQQFRNIALVRLGGTTELFSVASVNQTSTEEELVFAGSQTLAADIDHETTVICELIWCRFADREMEYSLRNDKTWTLTGNFLELPCEVPANTEYSPTVNEGEAYTNVFVVTQSGTDYFYADYAVDLTIDGDVFKASDMAFDGIKSSVKFLSEKTRLYLGKTSGDASPFLNHLEPEFFVKTVVKVYEVDVESLPGSLPAALYIGEVSDTEADDGGRIEVNLTSIMGSNSEKIGRVQLQRTCIHDLGDDNCTVDLPSLAVSGTIDAVDMTADPPYVDVSEFGDEATAQSDDDWFALGKLVLGGHTRMITGVEPTNTDRVYINFPFPTGVAVVSASVSATPGCSKIASVCAAKFDNLVNMIAAPLLPNSNPQFEALTVPQNEGGKK